MSEHGMSEHGMSEHGLPGRVRLLGGEMPTWSDLASAWEPARSGAQLPILLTALAGRSRVLVAGPHDPDLIAALAASLAGSVGGPVGGSVGGSVGGPVGGSVGGSVGGELTCLVRSIPDARLLGEAGGDRVRIVCGSLERFDETGYDAVVALDDVTRLYSTEGPEPAFGAALADLRRLLTPDGVLVVMVANELGAHRLLADVQPEADQSAAAWSRLPDADDTRPRGLADLAEQFGAGAAIWPVYPLPSAPVVAWGAAAGSVDRTEHAGLLAAISDAAARSLERARPWSDATSLLRRVWRSGRLPEFAAGWLVVATAGDREPATDDVVAWLVTDPGAPVAVRLADGRPVLPDGSEVPTGRLLSDVLEQAVVAPDQAALRSAVQRYAEWLGTLSDVGSAPAHRVVLGADGEHRLIALGAAGPLPGAKTADEQLLIAAADLVRRAEQHGYRRTWPSYLTPAEAVAWVAAMRGTPLPDDAVRRVVAATGLDQPLPARPGIPVAVAVATERFEESNASRARWFETRLKAAETQLATAWNELDKARAAYRKVARTRLKTRLKDNAPPSALRIGRAVKRRLRRAKRLARRLRG